MGGWWACLPAALLSVLTAGLWFAAAAPSFAQETPQDGDLRLMPDQSAASGRLEIYHSGEWRGVCDDLFRGQEATVACKQLGHAGGTYVFKMQGPSASFWLDDVNCSGSESRLADCSHPPWGQHDCNAKEWAGVICGPSVLLSTTALAVDEQSSAAYTVKLATVPSSNVVVTVAGHSGTDLTVVPTKLTFSTTTWKRAQTVTVSAGHDSDQAPDEETLTHSASGGGYGSVSISDVEVRVRDNDVPGVSVEPTSLQIDEGDATGGSYRVALTGEPTGTVTITASGYGGTDVSVSPASLTFTASNWKTAVRTVTVTAAGDFDTEHETVAISHGASGGGYSGVPVASVSVQVRDDDSLLTGEFYILPWRHDGSRLFWMHFRFNDEVTISESDMRNYAFEVTGGRVRRGGHRDGDKKDWSIQIEPESAGAITVALPADRKCSSRGAVCSAEGRRLSERLEVTIPGPLPTVSVSGDADSVPEGSPASFTLSRNGPRSALTVAVAVSEEGAVLAGTAPTEVQFASGSSTATLAVATDDDEAVDVTGAVTVAVQTGSGYRVAATGSRASVTVADDDAAPVIVNTGPFAAEENSLAVAALAATDADTDDATLSWSIAGGPDASRFTLTDAGALSFAAAQNYEAPRDADTNGAYEVTVQVSDGANATRAELTVHLSDVDELAPALTGASVDGVSLTLSWDKLLDQSSVPGASAFLVQVGGSPRGVTSVAADGNAVTLTLAAPVQAGNSVRVRYTRPTGSGATPVRDMAGNEAPGFGLRPVTNATGASNSAPTGLPAIAGTARVGETLTASRAGVADADGIDTSTVAWQWVANDGTADADIAGATGKNLTLTADQEGSRIKVRLTYTDNASEQETLLSGATPAVAAALRLVSIRASASPVTEGTAASFTLSRIGDAAAALTVSVAVSAAGSVVSGTLPSAASFAAGARTAALTVATVDDDTAEPDGVVTASVEEGPGYGVDARANSARVAVLDNDDEGVPSGTVLWMATLTVGDPLNGVLTGLYGNYHGAVSPDSWSEGGEQFEVLNLYYIARRHWLAFQVSASLGEPGELTLHLDDLELPLAVRQYRSYFYWTVPDPGWKDGQRVQVTLRRETSASDARAGLSVGDARAVEKKGAALRFPVTLDRAANATVSVRYATASDTATTDADYTPVSGVLRFGAGETAKTVSVPVLDDAHDEGSETLLLLLSDPFGAGLSDGVATGTIDNADVLPRAWMARFGRSVGQQALAAIEERIGGARGRVDVRAVLGGVDLGGLAEPGAAFLDAGASPLDDLHHPAWFGSAGDAREMSILELLQGSSFQLGAGDEADSAWWTVWGRFAAGGFEGDAAGVELSGEVITGLLGADVADEQAMAGIAVALSRGDGTFGDRDRDGAGGGRVQSGLTSVYPYASLGIGAVDIWAVLGAGTGDLTLTAGGEDTETDLSLLLGALGLRGEVLRPDPGGGFGLAVKSDALWVRTGSGEAHTSAGGTIEAAEADAARVRVALEVSRAFAMGLGATLTPTLELGLRHDLLDAETGTGVEAGVGVEYRNPARGLALEGLAHGLLTHLDGNYREWGASGAIRLDPGASGRGVSLTVAPEWGRAPGSVEQLWSGSGVGHAAAGEFVPEARLRAEIGYGLAGPAGFGVLTPYVGLSMADDAQSRIYRVGARWRAAPAFHLALEASHAEAAGSGAAATAATVTVAHRW